MGENRPEVVKTPLKLPLPTPTAAADSYVQLSPLDTVHSCFEASADISLTGSLPILNPESQLSASLTAIEAVSAGSNNPTSATTSAYFNHMRRYYQLRGFTPRFRDDRTLTAFIASAGTNAMSLSSVGIIALIKDVFGDGIKEGTLTASCSGLTSSGHTYSGELYDSGSAELQTEAGTTIGTVFNDDGLFTVTAAGSANIIHSITSVKFTAKTYITNLSVFCKCSPDELNYSYNFSAFNQDPLTSTLTGTTTAATYSITGLSMADFTVSGLEFNPRVTGIGLYNDDNDLIAIGKLSNPLPKFDDMTTTFNLSLDL